MAERTSYFRLRTSGWGYINKIRFVEPTNALPFIAVDAVLLQGPQRNPDRIKVSAIVTGQEAYDALRKIRNHVEDGKRVFARLVLVDLRMTTFVYQKGEREGQTGVNIQSRLIDISKAKADGVEIPLEVESSVPAHVAA